MSPLTIAIVGGGAAGFFGAITAAETCPDATVVILEKNRTLLNKVRISGGGRCNVTHACFDNRQLVKQYPRGEKPLLPLLGQFDAAATVRWFESRGARLKTEADGRMFPTTNTSETIVDCLLGTARRLGVQIRTSCGVSALSQQPGGRWQLQLLTGESLAADRVLIATGGYPQLSAYGWLPPQAGPLRPPVPSLFTFNVPDSPLLPLAGVSVADAKVSVVEQKQKGQSTGAPQTEQRELVQRELVQHELVQHELVQHELVQHELVQRGPLLLTHWGFSGPAVLRLSAWAARELATRDYRFILGINWVPSLTDNALRATLQDFRQQNGRKQVASQNPLGLPSRLWQTLAAESGIADGQRWADLPAKLLNRIIERLTNSQFSVVGKSTFKDEFVTCGGVAFEGLNAQTLESQTQPGLFFAGEVLNVDGITGGFNFQSAWTTGYVAGLHIGR